MPPSALALLQHIRRLASQAPPDPDADAVLLERFVRQRDEDAFAALVRRHGSMVRRVCRRVLADPGAADDAFQAAFCVLARKAAAVRPPEALASWLHGVALRVARKARAAGGRRHARERASADLDPPDPRPDPLAELSARELLAAVDEEVQRLAEVYRLPVILCCLEGRTREEAARLLGWTAGSVKGRLERGRARLHARLARRGLTLAAGLAAVECSQGVVEAGMPALLAGATVRAALAFASAQEAAAAGPSAWARALTEAVLRGLLEPRRKVLAALLLAAGLAATGAGLAAQHLLTAPPPEAAQDDVPKPPAGEPAPAGDRQARTDCFGDPLPPGVLQRLGTVRFRHGREALSIALSPDGKLLASAGLSSAIRLWDVATQKEVRQLTGHRGWVWAVAFSPDGKTVASASGDNSVRLWDPATGKELFRFGQHEAGVADGGVLCLAFSPDGKVLGSGGSSGVLHLWDAVTGKPLRTLEGHTDWIEAVAFAPDGKTAATGGRDKTVRLWDVAAGKELHALTGHEDTVKAVAFAPDGNLLASGGADRTIRLWDVARGKELRRCGGHQHAVSCLTFTHDGQTLVSGSHDWSVRAWDVASAKEIHQIAVHNGAVTSLAFSADGRTLATSSQTLRLWDPATWKEIQPSAGHQGWVGCLAFAPGGKELLSAASDETFRRWDLASGKELQRYHGHQARGKSVAFSPDGKVAATGAAGGLVQLWELPSGKELRRLAGHQDAVLAVAFSPDGTVLASASRDHAVRLWDPATGRELHKLEGHSAPLLCVAFAPDGRTVASAGEDHGIRLWQTATGGQRRLLEGHQDRVEAVAFGPDGKLLASAGKDGTLRLWETATGKEVRRVEGLGWVTDVAFAADGRTVATAAADHTARLWETATAKERARLAGHEGDVASVAFSPDGRTLASGSADTTILVWDLTGRSAGGPPAAGLAAGELETLWTDLAGEDAARAYRSLWRLATAPRQALPFLQEHVRPVPTPDARRLARLVAELDDDEFTVREKASEELAKLGDGAREVLEATRQATKSAEVRRRAQELLDKLQGPVTGPEILRSLRAVEALERIGSPDARRLLDELARGAPWAQLTREAKASLERLARRPEVAP